MDYHSYFKGKKITVMGLGLLGGVGDIRFLAEQGADLIVTDLKSPEESKPSLEVLSAFPNIRYTLGTHELADFRDRDLIIKAPSTPLDSPFIAEAKKHHIPVSMWAELFSRFAKDTGVPIIGVTGTRGKTTVTELIGAIVRMAGIDTIVGGNVRNTAMLPNLEKITQNSVVVLELDSWKLQAFGDAQISPNIAVFTTFLPDHMNYYKEDMAAYFKDKANIFVNQTEDDTLILGEQMVPFVTEYGYKNKIKARTTVVGDREIPKKWTLKIPGAHNRYNASLAIAATRAMGIDEEVIKEAVESFGGVPGRLEFLREVNLPTGQAGGVKIYNDTTATTPDATIAALTALQNDGRPTSIILIMGGADKGLDMSKLIAEIPNYCKKVILLAGSGTERIKGELPEAQVFDALAPAVAEAVASATAGDVIVLSPAFASFGMFKNEYDRGDQFTALVQSL